MPAGERSRVNYIRSEVQPFFSADIRRDIDYAFGLASLRQIPYHFARGALPLHHHFFSEDEL
jgi:hypothetical protein